MITLNNKLAQLNTSIIENCTELTLNFNNNRDCSEFTEFYLTVSCMVCDRLPEIQLKSIINDLGNYFKDCDDILQVTKSGIFLWTNVEEETQIYVEYRAPCIYFMKCILSNKQRRL